MTREKLVLEQQRLIRVQSAILAASKRVVSPELERLVEAIGQLTLTVSAILKEFQE